MHTVLFSSITIYLQSLNIILIICLHIVKWWKSSIRPIDETLAGTTIPGNSRPRSNGNEEVLRIPQIARLGTSLAGGSESYPGDSLWEGLSPLKRRSRRILQPQLTRLYMVSSIPIYKHAHTRGCIIAPKYVLTGVEELTVSHKRLLEIFPLC